MENTVTTHLNKARERKDSAQAVDENTQKLTPLTGKVALVTGAAAGIGLACVKELLAQGASVVGMDISDNIQSCLTHDHFHSVQGDVTSNSDIKHTIESCVEAFSGLDILVANAGIFTAGQKIEELDDDIWDKTLAVNLTSQQRLLKAAIPYLKLGIDPTIIMMGSRNMKAPGPGAAAYSVSKAGITQLARVAALELAPHGIRVNVLHPDAVFDTELWTDDVLERSASRYDMSVEEYKKKNLLKTEITSRDVAKTVAALAGPAFLKTTGAQISIDGGHDRVI